MNLNIYSKNKILTYKNINIVDIYYKNLKFSIMKNHISYIGKINKIIFFYKKKIDINLNNSYYIFKKNIFSIICDNFY